MRELAKGSVWRFKPFFPSGRLGYQLSKKAAKNALSVVFANFTKRPFSTRF